jgi:hypothetical protein
VTVSSTTVAIDPVSGVGRVEVAVARDPAEGAIVVQVDTGSSHTTVRGPVVEVDDETWRLGESDR